MQKGVKGFTKESGKASKTMQEYNKLKEKVKSLEKQIEDLEFEKQTLSQKVTDLEEFISKNLNIDYESKLNNTILNNYLKATYKNLGKNPNGYRYENLHEFFALLSFMGPHYFGILTNYLMFPTYKTAKTYRNDLMKKYGINDCIFNADIENVKYILNKFYDNNDESNGKAVIMVDAASVTPYVQVKEDGTVEGLIGISRISEKEAKTLIKNEDKFIDFIKEHYDSVIQAEFGITFAPITPGYGPIPIGCISSTSGKATLKIIQKVETLIAKLNSDYNIVGLGTDGDNGYDKYSNSFMENIIKDFESFLDLNAAEVIKKFATLIHFSDPFHLTKRDRYDIASSEEFFISPMKPDKTRSALDLLEIGVPPYLLDDNKGRKMEDMLPKKLFSLQTIVKIIEKGDFYLLISMLPSTLFLESIHRRELSIQDTIDYLLFGASIIMIYYFMLNNVINKKMKIYKKSPSSYKRKMRFSEAWCKQYIFTAIGIASLIITENDLDVGACSSHYQEHGFANIRRHSKMNNSHMQFFKSMKYILLERELALNLGIDEIAVESRSDSGKQISKDEQVILRPMNWYLKRAKRLWRNITRFPRNSILSKINDNRNRMSVNEINEIIKIFPEKVQLQISTKSTGMIKTAGLNGVAFWSGQKQLNDLIDDDEYSD